MLKLIDWISFKIELSLPFCISLFLFSTSDRIGATQFATRFGASQCIKMFLWRKRKKTSSELNATVRCADSILTECAFHVCQRVAQHFSTGFALLQRAACICCCTQFSIHSLQLDLLSLSSELPIQTHRTVNVIVLEKCLGKLLRLSIHKICNVASNGTEPNRNSYMHKLERNHVFDIMVWNNHS